MESEVVQSVVLALSFPDGAPALSRKTSMSSMLFELLAARSIWASMPVMVAPAGS